MPKTSPIDYYTSLGSRIGYQVLLGGTKHFGLFEPSDSRWDFAAGMRRMEDLLATTLALPKGAKLLDAGCGVGDVAYRLASVHGYLVTGIDIQDGSIIEANERAKDRRVADQLDFRVMSYDDLDFPAASFDGAYTMETLVHAENPATVLSEFYRVLKPGGRLVMFEYSHDKRMDSRDRKMLDTINDLAAMPGFRRFTEGTLEKLIGKAGFVDINSPDITESMLPMVKSLAQLAGPTYFFAKLIGRPTLSINAMAAVELWNMRRSLHYRVYSARKPRRKA